MSVLTESYRFPTASPVGRLADAVRRGDVEAALAVLADSAPPVGPSGPDHADDAAPASDGVTLRWAPVGVDTAAGTEALAAAALGGARRTMAAAEAGEVTEALDALGQVRVLCAHRRGPFGVAWWNQQFEDWLAGDGVRLVGSYVGRPVLVTANDAIKGLFNGDLGVVVRHDDAAWVAFPEGDGHRLVAPARVEAAETVHAMTIHKSQGSEFDEIVVVLPPADSRLATRELLYTAVTRARRVVTLVGGEDALRRAIGNRVVRQTGLRRRLWGGAAGPAAG